jgi:hypothetical protein
MRVKQGKLGFLRPKYVSQVVTPQHTVWDSSVKDGEVQ